jgi:hypothetical protein
MSGAPEMVAEVVELRERSQGPVPGGDRGALQQTIRLDALHVSLELLVVAVGAFPFRHQGAFQLLRKLHHSEQTLQFWHSDICMDLKQ